MSGVDCSYTKRVFVGHTLDSPIAMQYVIVDDTYEQMTNLLNGALKLEIEYRSTLIHN